MTQRNGLQKTLREKRSGGKRERNRAWHSDGRRRMTCMDAIRGKSSILFHANLANNCCIHVHQCFAPQSSWKFPQLYRFQSAMSFVSGQPQNLDIVAEIFFLLHIETLQGAGGGGGGGGWITVRRKVLAPAPPPFPSLFCESNLVPSASAHTREVFGQSVFALAGKWLFEVGRTTVIIGGPAIRFAGLQLQARRKWPTYRGSQQTNRSYMHQDQMSYFGLTFQCRPWE